VIFGDYASDQMLAAALGLPAPSRPPASSSAPAPPAATTAVATPSPATPPTQSPQAMRMSAWSRPSTGCTDT